MGSGLRDRALRKVALGAAGSQPGRGRSPSSGGRTEEAAALPGGPAGSANRGNRPPERHSSPRAGAGLRPGTQSARCRAQTGRSSGSPMVAAPPAEGAGGCAPRSGGGGAGRSASGRRSALPRGGWGVGPRLGAVGPEEAGLPQSAGRGLSGRVAARRRSDGRPGGGGGRALGRRGWKWGGGPRGSRGGLGAGRAGLRAPGGNRRSRVRGSPGRGEGRCEWWSLGCGPGEAEAGPTSRLGALR